MSRFVWETLRFREENVEYYFPGDVKKTTISSRAFYNLKSVRYAVECHGAHSGKKSHSKLDATLCLFALCGARLRAVLCRY